VVCCIANGVRVASKRGNGVPGRSRITARTEACTPRVASRQRYRRPGRRRRCGRGEEQTVQCRGKVHGLRTKARNCSCQTARGVAAPGREAVGSGVVNACAAYAPVQQQLCRSQQMRRRASGTSVAGSVVLNVDVIAFVLRAVARREPARSRYCPQPARRRRCHSMVKAESAMCCSHVRRAQEEVRAKRVVLGEARKRPTCCPRQCNNYESEAVRAVAAQYAPSCLVVFKRRRRSLPHIMQRMHPRMMARLKSANQSRLQAGKPAVGGVSGTYV